jgi:hypothetical protein
VGFPNSLDDSELAAAPLFFGNDRVTPEAILAPHFRQSVRRADEHDGVLVVHDTTQFEFGGQKKREGRGRLIRHGRWAAEASWDPERRDDPPPGPGEVQGATEEFRQPRGVGTLAPRGRGGRDHARR